MIRKVSLVAALFIMLILGMWIGDMLAQYRSHKGNDDSQGTETGYVSDSSATDLIGGFDELWDDEIYFELASLQTSGTTNMQQRGMRDPGGRRGGGEPQRRRSWADYIDTEELMVFLKEHEPWMASMLDRLKGNSEEKFNSRLPAYKEIYGPVMQQMKRDPEAGMLSLKKVRLNFYIPRFKSLVKGAEKDSDQYKTAMERLTGYVADEFDVIIEQQQAQVKRMEDRIKERSENTPEQVQAVQGERGRGGQRGSQRGGFNPDELRQEVEKRKKEIVSWQENKDAIVLERVEELLQDHSNFPWGD